MVDDRVLYDLVVVGASAGGIEALSKLVATLPADFPIPIVIAQHLDPKQPSHLSDILGRRGTLPVHTVEDAESLAPGVVYVVPSDRDVEITDHTVTLRTDSERRPKPSINLLLSSAARAYGERLIAVILTGTGTDGTAGAWDVKAAGGMVVIENPETAAYATMPASLAPTTVDIVANLERIGPLICDLVSGAYVPTQPDEVDTLEALLERVRQQSGIDFASYKRPTILRRLQRRMVVTGMPQFSDYLGYLQTHPEEYQRLVTSFLINVTEFFRDPEVFKALHQQVLPELIAHAQTHGNELRLWSAGCATGEEAYSLAILVAEMLGEELEQFAVRIFATDLDEDAIIFARRGVYPASALTGLSDELIARYFTRRDGEYEVQKRIRALTIFGLHDLAQRSPFPRIDMVLCRNVLIYFTPELQQRALRLFAYSLRDGGYLILGKAETPGPLGELFASVDAHRKLYRRQGPRILAPAPLVSTNVPQIPRPALPPQRTPLSPPMRVPEEPHGVRTASETLGSLMLGIPVGVVVVDRHYDVHAINAAAHRLLGIYRPAIGEDLIHLTESLPSASLRNAIDNAFRSVSPTALEQTVTIETALGERRDLQIICHPQQTEAEAELARYVIILVTDVTSEMQARRAAEEATEHARREHEAERAHEKRGQKEAYAREKHTLEQTLQSQRDEIARLKAEVERVTAINRELLDANQELTAANLDLRGTYEELLVSREEEQTTAEEVKTLNEELQSTNEELVTVNEELEATVEELHAANEDLQARSLELQNMATSLEAQRTKSDAERARLEAILLSMGDALLVVNQTGAAVLTNAAYARMFGGANATFAANDEEGHALPSEATPQQRATSGASFTMTFTLPAPDGTRRWFEARGEPIRDSDKSQGGVVTIRDITERSFRRLQDEFMTQASHELRSPLTTMNVALQMVARRLPPDAVEEGPRYYTELALRQAQRMKNLVSDLLDVGRLQSGKLSLKLKPVDLTTLVTKTVEAVQITAPTHTLALSAQAEPLMVAGDITRLEQVLVNLLTNAITYAAETRRVDVRLRQVDRTAEIQVQDYGPGIPAADLPHIFTRYYQVARTGERKPAGLGLGLHLTKELIVGHGGTITVDSHEGEGCLFTIQLPLLKSTSIVRASHGDEPVSVE